MARAGARAPSDGPPWPVWQSVLDGNQASQQWLGGVHPASALPKETYVHGPGAAPEVWINNNVFPDLTRPAGHATIDPNAYPLGMVIGNPTPTWRQVRARELLQPPVSAAASRDAAVDVQDVSMKALVPYFQRSVQEARGTGFLGPDPIVDVALTGLNAWDGLALPASPLAALSYLLRAQYEKILEWNAQSGSPIQVTPSFNGPYAALPPLSGFDAGTHPGDVLALSLAAHLVVHELYPALAWQSLASTVQAPPWSPSPVWNPGFSPMPWTGGGSVVTLGHIRAIDLTPANAPSGTGAVYPVGGAKDSLFQSGEENLAETLEETIAGTSMVHAEARNWLNRGTVHLLVTEFQPQGPVLFYLTPVGATEIASDPRRYLPAASFAARQLQPLHFDLAVITSPIHAVQVFPLVMP